MSAGHSPNVTCQNIIFFWRYINVVRQYTYRKSASLGNRGLTGFFAKFFDQIIKMKFYVSLAFICLLLPAGKNKNENKCSGRNWISFQWPVWTVWHCSLCAVCGLRCFTCRGVNPGTCDEIWTCPAHYDRCATTIGKVAAIWCFTPTQIPKIFHNL